MRFCGTTEFASGQWAGIELDEPEGKKENGSQISDLKNQEIAGGDVPGKGMG